MRAGEPERPGPPGAPSSEPPGEPPIGPPLEAPPPLSRAKHFLWLGLGWIFFGLGLIGVLVPGLPTTPFMILALWCFSNGSERLRHWLYTHPVFGPSLQRWNEHRVIPARAKLLSVGAMSASFAYMALVADVDWPYLAAAAALMLYGAVYILTKPSRVPEAK